MARRDPKLVALGRHVAGLRKTAGLTQEGLAERADINSQYVSEIERGTANPSYLVLVAVAEGLGLTVARMLASPDETDLEVAALLKERTVVEKRRALVLLRALFEKL
jgi:transcriptional regulator with XRE-family HTH domain